MSRRYGRNQKRRARAEMEAQASHIAALQGAIAMDRAMLRSQARIVEDQREQLTEVARILHTNFIGLKPALYKFENKHRYDRFRCPVKEGDVLMHTMHANITESPDSPDFMLHFRVELAGETVGYAISECALRDGPRDYLLRRISDEMALLLMGELRKKFGRSGR